MEYRYLGKSGLKISALSFGSWVTFSNQVGIESAIEMMAMSYDAGINFFDNAEVYADGESELIMGQALKKLGWARDTYCVSSKVFWTVFCLIAFSYPLVRAVNRDLPEPLPVYSKLPKFEFKTEDDHLIKLK